MRHVCKLLLVAPLCALLVSPALAKIPPLLKMK